MDYWFLGHLILWGCSLLIAFVCLRRLLALLKPLRNVYYYKLYQLDLRPADVRRVTVWQCSKRLVHAIGMCTYSDLQFGLPPSLHAYLWVCFLVTALVANYMCSLIFLTEDSFRPEIGAALGAGCSLLCISLVLTLESTYVFSLNQNNKISTVTQYGLDMGNVSTVIQKVPAGARQEVTETNNASTRRQTGIEPLHKEVQELTFRMNADAVEVSSDSLLPGEAPSYSAAKSPRPMLELSVLFLFVCIGVAAVWGTYVIVLRADVRLENCLMMWLVSVGTDFPVRIIIAFLLGKTGLMRNFTRDYVALDYGLRASDLGRFSPVPREEPVMSPTAHTGLLPASFQQEVEIAPENTIEPLHYPSRESEESSRGPRSSLQPPTLGNSHRESLTPDSPRPAVEPLRNPFQLPEAPQKPASPSEASPEDSPVAAQTPPELQYLFKGIVRSPEAPGQLPAPGLPTSPPKAPILSPQRTDALVSNSFSLQEPAPENHAQVVIPAPIQSEPLVSEDQKQPVQSGTESCDESVNASPENYFEPVLPVADSRTELIPHSPAHSQPSEFEGPDQSDLQVPEDHTQPVLPEPESQVKPALPEPESQVKPFLPEPESQVKPALPELENQAKPPLPEPESQVQISLPVSESSAEQILPESYVQPVLPAPESHTTPVLPASAPESLAHPASLPSVNEASVSLPARIEPSPQTPRTPQIQPETPELPSETDEEPIPDLQAAALLPDSSEPPQEERTDLTTPQRIELSRLSLQEDSDHSPKESEAESLQESVEELPESSADSEDSIPEVIVVQYSSRPSRRRKQESLDDSREESKEPLPNALAADEEVLTRPVSALLSLSGSHESNKPPEVAKKPAQRKAVKTPPEPNDQRVAFPDPFPVPREEDQYSDIVSTGRRTRAAFPAPPQHAQPIDILLEPEKPIVSQKPPRVVRKDKPKKRRQQQTDEKHWSEGDDHEPPIIDSLVKPRQAKPALMKPHRSERSGSPEAAEAAPWRVPGDILYDEDLPIAKGTHQFGFSAGQPLKLAQYEADVFNRVQSPTAANDNRVSFHTSETSTSRTIPPPIDPREAERRRIADELLRLSQSHSQLSEVDVDRLNEILDARVEFHRKYGYRPNDFESPYEEILRLREEEPSEIRKPVAAVPGAQRAAKLRSLYDRYKEGSSRPGKALSHHDSLPSFGIGAAPDMSKARRKLYQMMPSRSSANLVQHDLLNIQLPSSPIHEDPDDHSPRILTEVWR